jgi:hypothetical protein
MFNLYFKCRFAAFLFVCCVLRNLVFGKFQAESVIH